MCHRMSFAAWFMSKRILLGMSTLGHEGRKYRKQEIKNEENSIDGNRHTK